VIVDCAHYRDGVRQNSEPLPLEEVDACRVGDGSFLWVGLYEPSDDELGAVSARFGLHELAVEDAANAHQRPKVEKYDASRFLVLHSARYDDENERVVFGELHAFIGADYVVTVRHGEASELGLARNALEKRPDLLKLGPASVVWAVLDKIVDDYRPVVSGLENDIEEVQGQIFGGERLEALREWQPGREEEKVDRTPGANPTERVYFLIREVTQFGRAVRPLLEPLQAIESGALLPEMPDGLRPFFRDVSDHLQHIAGDLRSQSKLLDSILQANLALVTVRQNESVKTISAWAAMIAVPTFIASIYGMNFDDMPELGWTLGYPLALLLMVTVIVGLYAYFKRVEWL